MHSLCRRRTPRIKRALVAALLALLISVSATAQNQGSKQTVQTGVYTVEQAKRGQALFTDNCAIGCHNQNLAGGGPTPPLAGDDFLANWDGLSLADLFKRIRTTMPKTHPGALSDDQYLAIIAYLLQANGFPAGQAALKNDPAMLDRTEIAAKK